MANIKVSEMTEATTFDDGDYTMIVQANQNKKISKENMLSDIPTIQNNIITINTNIGDLTNLETFSTDNLVNAINSNLPITLYNNPDGSNATITLSDDAANYSFLEIYFTDNNKGFVDFKKIENPNNKSIGMNLVSTTGSHGTFVRTCTFTISNDTIVPNYWTYYTVNTNNTIAGYSYSTNYVYITKVLGYK